MSKSEAVRPARSSTARRAARSVVAGRTAEPKPPIYVVQVSQPTLTQLLWSGRGQPRYRREPPGVSRGLRGTGYRRRLAPAHLNRVRVQQTSLCRRLCPLPVDRLREPVNEPIERVPTVIPELQGGQPVLDQGDQRDP